MNQYVRCIKNETLFAEDEAEDLAPHLIVGRVYKVAPPCLPVIKQYRRVSSATIVASIRASSSALRALP